MYLHKEVGTKSHELRFASAKKELECLIVTISADIMLERIYTHKDGGVEH